MVPEERNKIKKLSASPLLKKLQSFDVFQGRRKKKSNKGRYEISGY